MAGRGHRDGICTCVSHVDRPWDRSEHWTAAEVEYLEARFGRNTDAAIARHLGRTVVGIRLKAKRLGIHKRDAGMTARGVAEIFGVDPSTVATWIERGALAARRGWFAGPRRVWLVGDGAVERFIREHGEQIDVEKMPDSPYRDAAAREPWIGLPEVHRRTGRNPHAVAWLIRSGVIAGRRRGAHWYVRLADVGLVPPLKSAAAIAESVFRRDSVLRHRRDVRKGLRRPLPKRELRHRLFTIHRLTRAEFEAHWAAQEEIA